MKYLKITIYLCLLAVIFSCSSLHTTEFTKPCKVNTHICKKDTIIIFIKDSLKVSIKDTVTIIVEKIIEKVKIDTFYKFIIYPIHDTVFVHQIAFQKDTIYVPNPICNSDSLKEYNNKLILENLSLKNEINFLKKKNDSFIWWLLLALGIGTAISYFLFKQTFNVIGVFNNPCCKDK